jgi:prolyl-tRNA editing enzyme YbaK/EbsC (Cys-tRNA(Pro) deacylase)
VDSILEKAAVKRAQAALDKHAISGKIKILTDSARTAAEAAAGLGIEVGQIASSLVFKLPDDRSLLVITSGRHRVDTEMVAELLQVPTLNRADANYVKEISGYSVGGVAPLGWINEPSITLIDEALSDYRVIWAAAGHPHAVFPTSYQELLQASGAKAARVGN